MMALSLQRAARMQKPLARAAVFPAPTKGWVVGANIAAAPKGSALVMDNWFPQLDSLRLRRGAVEHAQGMTGGPVNTLIPWSNGIDAKLFAACNDEIHDVTAAGAVGAAEVGSLGSDRWQFVQFANVGGTWLRAVNGADTPLVYDGSDWGTSPAITGTGLAPANLINVWVYRRRLFFIEKGTLSAWFLDVDSIGGTATELPMGAEVSLGGQLIAGGSWTILTSNGMVESCVFITSQGEVVAYEGSDPTNPDDWTKRGTYKMGRPLGYRCLVKAGGDLAVLTEDGIAAMSQVISLDRAAVAAQAITSAIGPVWRETARTRLASLDWSMTIWPQEQMTVVNVPAVAADDRQQYVANSISGAWCRYTGWDSRSWAVHAGGLYYGTSDGRVMLAETGGNDDGQLYTGSVLFAYDSMKTADIKQATLIRALMKGGINFAPKLSVLADYRDTLPVAPSAAEPGLSGPEWGSFVWGVDPWGLGTVTKSGWKAAAAVGSALAPAVQVSVNVAEDPGIQLQRADISYFAGGLVG